MTAIVSDLRYPIAIIDFEASSLDRLSYPIEVGIAIIDAPGLKPRIWSTLIRPAQSWLDGCGWDPDAERVHRIRQYELRNGSAPDEAATTLNAQLAPIGYVWCDGGHYDRLWLNVLFEAAGLQPSFQLRHLGELFGTELRLADRYRAAIAGSKVPHRAALDAARIAEALSAAIWADALG